MGIVAQWKAFGAFAVEWLGMPAAAMLLFVPGRVLSRKARQICRIVLESGNRGPLVSPEISEAAGKELHLPPPPRRILPPPRYLPNGCSVVLCEVCKEVDEGGGGVNSECRGKFLSIP